MSSCFLTIPGGNHVPFLILSPLLYSTTFTLLRENRYLFLENIFTREFHSIPKYSGIEHIQLQNFLILVTDVSANFSSQRNFLTIIDCNLSVFLRHTDYIQPVCLILITYNLWIINYVRTVSLILTVLNLFMHYCGVFSWYHSLVFSFI